MTGNAELRVLIVAENASTRFGGEASLPFHYFRVLRARGVDAWLLVHERTRAELLEAFPAEADRMVFAPDTVLHKVFYRASTLLPRRVGESTFGLFNQWLTQRSLRVLLRTLLTPGTVVHQPIPVSPRAPSLLHDVGAPVLIGPMNGGMDYPAAFRRSESPAVRAAVIVGRATSGVMNRLMPGKRDASVLLVANRRTSEALPIVPRGQVVELVENGVDLQRWPLQAASSAAAAHFLFVGRLVDWKALDVLLHALVNVPGATLDVVGDGAMREAWEQLSRDLHLQGKVQFLGWRSQAECAGLLRRSTALVLPSLFECGGAVVLEAMSVGRPVIATDWGGPADYLDASCGILVAPTSREVLIAGFAAAMQKLAADPVTCASMGRCGRVKVEQQYDWEKKVDVVLELYRKALGEVRA